MARVKGSYMPSSLACYVAPAIIFVDESTASFEDVVATVVESMK